METHRQQKQKAILVGGLLIGSLVVVFALIGLLTNTAVSADQAAQGGATSWTTVFTETFESNSISGDWSLNDGNGTEDGEYLWATTDAEASEGTYSAWATGGGAQGSSLQPGTDDYPNNALSYMIRGPVDLSGTTSARLTFDYWSMTAESFDALQVQVSTDGSSFAALNTLSGDSNGWQTETVNLNAYAGESQVWISFFFTSNAASTDLGIFVDNITLETRSDTLAYLPILKKDPTPTPSPTPTNTPTPTPEPYYYYDDFSDDSSGWPVVDNTHVSNDCFKWYYSEGDYLVDICDDRTDVKVSPLVELPEGDYSMEVEARFRYNGGWEHSYGIMFDAKDDPDPDNPDLGDYYMIWVLWHGADGHLWKLLKDVPGGQEDLTEWQQLPEDYYDYGTDGLSWNTWRVERTEDKIRVYVNDHFLQEFSEQRPRTNHQTLFGVYAATYETHPMEAAFDNLLIERLDGTGPAWQGTPQPFFDVGDFDLEMHLPKNGE